MFFQKILAELEKNKNSDKAHKMSAYMLHQFDFLGIQAPERRSVTKEFFSQMKKTEKINWDFIEKCWSCPYREMQYVATDYLNLMKKYLKPNDIPFLENLVIRKSWWDSVDNLHQLFGEISLKNPHINNIFLEYSLHQNFWLRRIAINHQLLRKDKTNTELLETIIVNNLGQTEFFINKAIGWALRDYSKTNPTWVRNFISKYQHKMTKLSIREASKYI